MKHDIPGLDEDDDEESEEEDIEETQNVQDIDRMNGSVRLSLKDMPAPPRGMRYERMYSYQKCSVVKSTTRVTK